MDTKVSLVIKVLWKLISLIYFRVYLEVNVHKNPMRFSRWSVRLISYHIRDVLSIESIKDVSIELKNL